MKFQNVIDLRTGHGFEFMITLIRYFWNTNTFYFYWSVLYGHDNIILMQHRKLVSEWIVLESEWNQDAERGSKCTTAVPVDLKVLWCHLTIVLFIVGLYRYPNRYHKPTANGCGSYGIQVCTVFVIFALIDHISHRIFIAVSIIFMSSLA